MIVLMQEENNFSFILGIEGAVISILGIEGAVISILGIEGAVKIF